MGSITKVTFVFVPGVLHTAAHAQTLIESLHAKGHPVEIIAHPTIGPLASTAPPNADAANLRSVLERLINDEQKDIILFCHSYGGVPGSQSVNGLERKARAKAGQKGGILKVIYLTAVLQREGESLIQTMAGAEIAPGNWTEMDPATGTFSANSKAAAALFHDLPDAEAEHLASKLEPMSAHIVATVATNVCWETDIPKVYIFCKKDRAFSLQEQQRMLERVQGDRKDDWDTHEMECGHSPFLSHVEELTGILTAN
ncbi:Alpha/beta hydrolase fold-1 [Mycena capillaripes]|nr:Alpha/beta hydrolase fold-1 [Mycena capillaripes]